MRCDTNEHGDSHIVNKVLMSFDILRDTGAIMMLNPFLPTSLGPLFYFRFIHSFHILVLFPFRFRFPNALRIL